MIFHFMNKIIFCLLFYCWFSLSIAQEFNGHQLLEKAIAYHDPNSQWNLFNTEFKVTMESPSRPLRKSKILLNIPASFFRLRVNQSENILTSILDKGNCYLEFNGKTDFSEEIQKKYHLDCDRAKFYKDYYSYLYGLPMKLKDPGTIIDPKIKKIKIDQDEFWILKVTYEESVGSDTWYFFFDNETYALKKYKFYHDESKNDGEYILLEDELLVGGIKMPKNRSWYLNSNNEFLGIDRLSVN